MAVQANYPENLGRAVIINAPWVFSGAWKLVSPVLNQRTQDKISIESGPARELLVELLVSLAVFFFVWCCCVVFMVVLCLRRILFEVGRRPLVSGNACIACIAIDCTAVRAAAVDRATSPTLAGVTGESGPVAAVRGSTPGVRER